MQQGHYFWELWRKLLLVFIAFTGLRLLFFVFHYDIFASAPISDILISFLAGLRFDGVAIVYINSLLILTFLLPLRIRGNRSFQNLQFAIFLITNGIALAFEVIDLAYFPYTYRRTITSDLDIIRTNSHLGAQLLAAFWWLLLIYFLLLSLLGIGYRKWEKKQIQVKPNLRSQLTYFLVGILLFGLMARGGWQLRPLTPIYAGSYAHDKSLIPLLTNTSLNLIFSLQQKQLVDPAYFTETELDQLFSINKTAHQGIMKKDNVMIIVLESFGKEFVGFYQNDSISYTPFLDSLLTAGKQCQWSFANGMRSTKGIVAITAGIPALMEDPLMFSAYQSNQVNGLAALLGKRGYQSTFFHGANPGSMEFEKFCQLSGFDDYSDREDYGIEQDYDGQWGIWDVPYFSFVADHLNQIQKPFFSVLFSLTSHHPFKTEPWFEKKFAEDPPKMRAVRYTDYALGQFFQKIKKEPWFDRTLFVITGDHIGLIDKPYYFSRTSRFEVPILYYHPQEQWRDTITSVTQHIDIMPSILDYLNYDLPYTAFGQSVFDPNRQGRAYAYLEGLYHYIDDDFVLNFDGRENRGMFDFRKDPHQHHPMNKELPEHNKRMEEHLKAVIQRHHRAMLHNSLYSNELK